MRDGEDATASGAGRAVDRLREALDAAREAVRRAEAAVQEVEREGSGRPAEVQVEAPRWTWRAKLWACPPETRLGVDELAEALDVSPSWIYQRTKAGADPRLPHRKMGGTLQFLAGEVRHFVREHEECPLAGPSWSPADGGLGVVEGGG